MHKILTTLVLSVLFTASSFAQCSMCRAVVESNENNLAAGLNSGIVYLMVFPYLFLMVVGYMLFRKFRKDNLKFGFTKA